MEKCICKNALDAENCIRDCGHGIEAQALMENQQTPEGKIERFDIYGNQSGGTDSHLDETGYWVKYEDHEKAISHHQEANAKLVEALRKFTLLNPKHYKDIAGLVNNAVDVLQTYETK